MGTRWPLVHVATAAQLLHRDWLEIRQGCEDGTIAWSWNLGAAGARRAEIRIWHRCVDLLRNSGGADGGAGIAEAAVLDDVFPPRTSYLSSEIKRRLQISRTALAELIAAKELEITQAATQLEGPNAACRISRASLVAMMKRRRV